MSDTTVPHLYGGNAQSENRFCVLDETIDGSFFLL